MSITLPEQLSYLNSPKKALSADVEDLLSNISKRYYKTNYSIKICEKSRAKMLTNLLYLLQEEGKNCQLSILDVGCGIGDIVIFLNEFLNDKANKIFGSNLFPIDSKPFIDEYSFSKALGEQNERIKFMLSDADQEPIPLPDKSIDVVMLVDVIEHLNNPLFALQESNRVLKQGGYLCLKTPNFANLKNRTRLLMGKSSLHDIDGWLIKDRWITPKGDERFQGHIREYTLEEAKIMLKYAGLEPILSKFHKTEQYPHHKELLKIYNIFELLIPHFAYEYSIIAIKK